MQGLVLDAGQENVVTVFGFPNNRSTEEMVLQEFGKCGDILRYHSDSQSNWMHIQYGVGHLNKLLHDYAKMVVTTRNSPAELYTA